MQRQTTQEERRLYLIDVLEREMPGYAAELAPACGAPAGGGVPADERGQRDLLRALMNVRPPVEPSPEFLRVQDDYLRERARERGITDVRTLAPVASDPRICLWQGDITTLACDAIVNAANSQMLGCWVPGHRCIDNAIHSFAGVELRLECARLMAEQGHEEPTGRAKVTSGWNLPCRRVIHTVGPIAQGRPTARHRMELARCYESCLDAAAAEGLRTVAFCCISTGIFGFPAREAAGIARRTVTGWLDAHAHASVECVVFNVFKDSDLAIYQELLG